MMEKRLVFETCYIDEKEYHTRVLAHRLMKQDIVVMLMCEYIGDELQLRKNNKLSVVVENIKEYQIGDVVLLKCNDESNKPNITLGHAIVKSIDDGKNIITLDILDIYVKSGNFNNQNDFTKNVDDLFTFIDFQDGQNDEEVYQYIEKQCSKEYISNDIQVKKKYISGLFHYYYDFIFQLFHDNDNYYSISKLTAMSSYIIAKKYFQKQGKIVSSPNVFIRGFGTEFDFLLLNEKDDNKYVFDIDEIEAIVELKANGIVGYGEVDKEEPRWFKQYINFQLTNEKYKSEMDTSLFSKIQDKPFYYYCFYEKNESPIHAYLNTLYDIYNSNNHEGIYLAITNDSYHYLIPVHYQEQ